MAPTSRNGGYSFIALVGVIVVTVCLSLSALKLGAHLAVAMERMTPPFPFAPYAQVVDPLAVFLGWGSWVGAVVLCALPPHEFWRGRVAAAFPVGTSAANVLASAGMPGAPGYRWRVLWVPEHRFYVGSGIELAPAETFVFLWDHERPSLAGVCRGGGRLDDLDERDS
ncbi:hypothetical protein V2A60_009607 [Cordyceps javanica]